MKLSYKKIIIGVTSILSMLAAINSYAYNTPYGEYKESDFNDNVVNNIFVDYINKLQKNDLTAQQDILNAQKTLIEKIEEEKKRKRFLDEDKKIFQINKIIISEKSDFHSKIDAYYINELKIFRDFINNIKNNRSINNEDKVKIIEFLKPVNENYNKFRLGFNDRKKELEDVCFGENNSYFILYENEFCLMMYRNFDRGFISSLRQNYDYSIKEFINKYLLYLGQGESSFDAELIKKIEEYRKEKGL